MTIFLFTVVMWTLRMGPDHEPMTRIQTYEFPSFHFCQKRRIQKMVELRVAGVAFEISPRCLPKRVV